MELGKPREEMAAVDTPAGTRSTRSNRFSWKNRTGLEKILFGISCVTLLACVALVSVLAVSSSSSNSGSVPSLPYSASQEDKMDLIVPVNMLIGHNEAALKETRNKEVKKRINKDEVKKTIAEVKLKKQIHTKINEEKEPHHMLPFYLKVTGNEKAEICSTPECTLAAADIIEAMDDTVNPCVDFYNFACGGWIVKNPVPQESSRWSQFDVLRKELSYILSLILSESINATDPLPLNQAKGIYSACMDEVTLETVGITPLVDILTQFGGWPMTLQTWNESIFNYQGIISASKRELGSDYLINSFVFADERDTFNTAIYVDQTSLGMPRSVLTVPENYAERFAAYKTYIKATALLVSAELGQTIDDPTLDQDIDDMVNFEMSLAHSTTPSEERRSIDRMYNPMTVDELSQLTTGSSLDWTTMLNDMFGNTNITVDGNTRVIVIEPGYIQNISQTVDAVAPHTLANYLMWRHIMALGDETNQAMRDASFQYQMVANGVLTPESRWKVCADLTNSMMGFAVGTVYVQRYFSEQAKTDANLMVEDIRTAFKDLLQINEWMDNETKPLASEKADAISKFIAYPDWYMVPGELEKYYSGINGVSNANHFNNILILNEWHSTDQLNDYGLPTERDRWLSPPTIVNAYYMPEFNSITFPAGILQPPFYRANSIQALNYGGIGQVIGHEITHGFDDQGSQNDKDGNAIPWWTNETLIAFNEKAQCIIDQYNNYRVPEIDEFLPGATVNGINTQGENIADNGGLRATYLAYLKYVNRTGEEPRLPGLDQYTPEQIFFLSNANIWCSSITTEGLLNQVLTDPHSPSQFRVIGPMSNMMEFSNVWNCTATDPMNPANKCIVW